VPAPESAAAEAVRPAGDRRSRLRRGLFVISLVALTFHVARFAGDNMGLAAMSAAMAIVERGTLQIDPYARDLREVSWRDGHYYSGMPPGKSFVAVPVYALTRPILAPAARALMPVMRRLPEGPGRLFSEPWMVRRMLLMLLVHLLVLIPVAACTTVMLFDLARSAVGDRPGAFSLALLLAFGSLWWAHAAGGSARTFAATLVLALLWWVAAMRAGTAPARRPWAMLGLGAAAGLAVATRYDMILMVIPPAIYAVARTSWRERLGLAAGLALALGLAAVYHYAAFGSPLRTPYNVKLTPVLHIRQQYRGGTEGLTWIEHCGEPMAVYNQDRRELRLGNIYDDAIGGPTALLRFTPPLALALVGVVLLGRAPSRSARELALVTGAAVLGNFLAVSLIPFAGFMGSVGPRYMMPAVPFLMLLMAPAWVALWPWARGVLLGLCFVPSYLAAMFTERVESPLAFDLVARFGLSNYIMSRAQEAHLGISPGLSTAVCLAFWAVMVALAMHYLRPPHGTQPRVDDGGRGDASA